MEILHKIKMDLVRQGISPRIPVVQGDTYTRKLVISLFADKRPWKVPSDASVVIRYLKPDRTSGAYDTLADGTPAVTAEGNTLSILVAPQALALAGMVALMVTIFQGEKRLSTFAIDLAVQADCTSGMVDQEGAAWIAAFLPSPQGAQEGQYLTVKTVDAQGHVLSLDAQPLPDPAQDVLEDAVAAYLDKHDIRGQDGLTPFIGQNGNWWLGDTDTGVSATGSIRDPGEVLWETRTISGFTATTNYASAHVSGELPLRPGAVYNVVWDGVAYRCSCAALPKDSNLSYLGNLQITGAGSDTGEPFLLVSDGQQTQLVSSELNKNHHSIAIYALEQALPEVSTADNGKILRVVAGVWTAAQLTRAEEVAL